MNNKYFKVQTVEQFKVLTYINDNFEDNTLKLELIDRYTILATDKYNDKLIFYYEDDTVKTKDVWFQVSRLTLTVCNDIIKIDRNDRNACGAKQNPQ